MLFRFLGIATMSVTFLTIQAMNSTETKSQRASASLKLSAEEVILDNPDQISYRRTHQIKSPLKGFKTSHTKENVDPAEKQNLQHSFNPIFPRIVLASIGEISLVLPKVKFEVRPSYLPPIDLNEKEESEDTNDTITTASTSTKLKSFKPKTVKATKTRFKKKRKITTGKRFKKKYKKHSRKKYKRKHKSRYAYKSKKRYKHRTKKYKRKYKKRYVAKRSGINGYQYNGY